MARRDVDAPASLELGSRYGKRAARGTDPYQPSVLVVADAVEAAPTLVDLLAALGWRHRVVADGAAAIAALVDGPPDVAVADLRLIEGEGRDLLAAAQELDPDLPVIVLVAPDSIEAAIEAMRRGAYHYVVRPLRLDELRLQVDRALAARQLQRELRVLRATAAGTPSLIGRSAAMIRLFDLIARVAPSPSPVLLRGERGTGKELVARAIHDAGPRWHRAFVAGDCSALPESLLESELFGHVRGAIPGATTARAGLFHQASGGTLFLDEIDDLSPALQARLLRAVQLGEIRPVGADADQPADVRLIVATHQDLEQRVERPDLRADLYYRLNVVPIVVPPLRERAEDVPLLVDHFLARSRARNGHSPVERVSPALVSALAGHPWAGNVRELENAIERLVVVGTRVELDVADLSEIVPSFASADRFEVHREPMPSLRQLEDEYIAWVVARCPNKTRAAEVLGVDVSTIHRRIRGSRDGA